MKRILGLTIAALLIMAIVGGGTWAYFSDTETSTNNVFTAGTLDLKVSSDNTTFTDGLTVLVWGGSAVKPSGTPYSGTVYLKNPGTTGPDHVEIKFSNAVTNYVNAATVATDTGDPDIADMSTSMNVTALSYGGGNLLALTGITFDNADVEAADNAGNNDQHITLSELHNRKLGNLTPLVAPLPSSGNTLGFTMAITIPTTVVNGIQGDSVDTTVTFGLFQDASQHLP